MGRSSRKRQTRRKRYHLDGWSEGKYFIFVMLAEQIVCSAEDIHFGIEWARSGHQIPGGPAEPDSELWISFYTDPTPIVPVVGNLILLERSGFKTGGPPELTDPAEAIFPGLSDFIGTIENSGSPEIDFGKLQQYGQKLVREAIRVHRKMLFKPKPKSKRLPKAIQQTVLSDELRFFLGVMMPCWLEFGVLPDELFEKAKAGDWQALRDLLWLDHLALEDEAIRRRFFRIVRGKNESRKNEVLKAVAKRGKRKISLKKVKYLCAGLVVQYFSMGLEHWTKTGGRKIPILGDAVAASLTITIPEVRQLFKEAYADKEKLPTSSEPPHDPDIAPGGWALDKAVQRHSRFWKPFFDALKADIFSAAGVRVP